jgi:tRNA threonylcarbamoyl adenosine modification protein YjeE
LGQAADDPMFLSTSRSFSFTVMLADERATRRLMTDVAALIEPGDLITLSGDLGAGKTTFARALIRYLAEDAAIEVPSPTFTLTQAYDLPRFRLVHADLYRLSGPAELTELGFDDEADSTVTLLEWPDRAAGFLPADRLDITLTLSPQHSETFRNARVTGYGSFAPRAERILAIRQFLDANGFGEAERRRIQGDASTRSYERLTRDGATYIFMNSPKRPDGLPVHDGKPYSAIAHLAEDVTPFVAMALGLRERGFSAPAIFALDRAAGLVVIEDLGDELMVADDPPAPIEARYAAAVELLEALHRERLPEVLPVEEDVEYHLPHYDAEALLIEAELLLDWYLPKLGAPVSDTWRDSYLALWHEALIPVLEAPATWVLRDFHSPNLLWLPEREGVARVGLLDFQDAVIGHPAYDLASLLQDARVEVPEMMEIALLSQYTRLRLQEPGFDAPEFARAYATLAAQRASKILGIFARLDLRDGKPQYLRHLPRVWAYLKRALAHPTLAELAAWYRVHAPRLTS